MDPQYATVDQLAEITDTMTSLRDAILELGQRIDGHQAQPLPISGSTDECLKHSSYTRVGSSFSHLFYRNFIVFLWLDL